MTETTPPNPDGATEQIKTIVHELWRGNICIELTGHLNIFVGHKLEHITPAMLALKSGARPEKVIWEAFPNWQTLPWEEKVPLTTPPTPMLTGPDGSHILLGPAQGESTRKIDLIKAFHDWMLAWKAEERAMACAEEDEFEDEEEDPAPNPVETRRPTSTPYGVGSFLIAANHISFLDPPFIGCQVPRQIAYFARKTLWKPGFASWWLDTVGTIEVGKQADLAIWSVESPAELVYRIGFNPLHQRIWNGHITQGILS